MTDVKDMSYANMREADMSHADMSHANMSHANMSHANMSHANMREADMSHANMSGAKWDAKIICILTLRADYTFYVCADGIIRAGCREYSPEQWKTHVEETYPGTEKAALTLKMIEIAEKVLEK